MQSFIENAVCIKGIHDLVILLLQARFVQRGRETVSISSQPPRGGRHIPLPCKGSNTPH